LIIDILTSSVQFLTRVSNLSQTWLSCYLLSSGFMLLLFLIHIASLMSLRSSSSSSC